MFRHSFPVRHALALAACTLLVSCGGGGGGGGGGSGTGGSLATPPAANGQAIVLLAENPTGYFAPGGIALDQAGNLFVGNSAQYKIFKLTQDGVVSDFVGNSSVVAGTDGIGSAVGIANPTQLVFDKNSQLLYVVDGNIRSAPQGVRIRRINAGGATTTLALSTFPSHAPADATLLPTRFGDVVGALAQGADGTLYGVTVNDVNNNGSGSPHAPQTYARLVSWRTIDAGGGGHALFTEETGRVVPASDTGRPAAASYQYPADLGGTAGIPGLNLLGLAVDHAGNGYVADYDRHIIVKITPAGVASIFAGTADKTGAADGAGTAAQFNGPSAIVVDKADNLYVVDHGNATVRKITPAGMVSTVVGVAGQNQTSTGALPGALGNPWGLAIDDNNRLYITVNKGVLRVQLP